MTLHPSVALVRVPVRAALAPLDPGDVVAVDHHGAAFDDDVGAPRERDHRLLVVVRDSLPERFPADRAIHRAGVDVAIAELFGEGS